MLQHLLQLATEYNMEEKTDTIKIETKPTLYRPEYCAKVEEYIGQGHSMESFAHTVNVVRSTIYDWKDNFPEFKEALDRGFSKRQERTEKLLQTCAESNVGNASVLIFLGKNWAGLRDKMEVDNLNVNTTVDSEKLSEDRQNRLLGLL